LRSSRRPVGDLVAVLFAAAVAAMGGIAPSSAQVSPGPLSRAHASLDGSLKCFECHATGGSGVAPQCLTCHKEIAWLVERDRGLHAAPPSKDCASCHPEHAGVEFQLIRWDEGSPERFDHRRAGWPLEGKHASLRCAECHKAGFRVSEAQKLSPRRDTSRGWTGLEAACGACHRDPHESTLGSDCARCHGTDAWRPAARFDHAKSAYSLTGKHRDAACEKCHRVEAAVALPAGQRPLPRYKPQPHAECSACHADPHAARLGPDCSRCHVTDDFHRVARDEFDHSRTRYPLAGRHIGVACAKCHDPGRPGVKPRFDRCDDCHTDGHAGQATLAGRPADCAGCHGVAGFRPAAYSVAQHASARYPLEGKHRGVACDACHKGRPGAPAPGVERGSLGRAGVLLRPRSARCVDCHADAHKAQLESRRDQGECGACHTPGGWKPSTFGVPEHARTRLPLAGRHAAIACAACHGPERTMLPPLAGPQGMEATWGRARVALKLESSACESCHRDPHGGRFTAQGDRPVRGGCADCHGASGFIPTLYDIEGHAKSRFPLAGAHRAVPCVQCHTSLDRRGKVPSLLLASGDATRLEFRERSGACAACPENPHGSQFQKRAAGAACDGCHGVESFRPAARFDHARLESFPLTGAHAGIVCSKCHPARQKDGRTVVTYIPIPNRCQDCHGRKPVLATGTRGIR